MDLHEGQPAIHLYIIEIVRSVICCFRLCMQINLPPFISSSLPTLLGFPFPLNSYSSLPEEEESPLPCQETPARDASPDIPEPVLPLITSTPIASDSLEEVQLYVAMKLQRNHCWNDGTLLLSLCYAQEEIATRGGCAHRLCSHSCDRRAKLDQLTALIFEALTVYHADFRALTVDFA